MSKRYTRLLTPDEIARVKDADIDTSDIPDHPEDHWAKAKMSPSRTRPDVSLCLPPEVVEYIKAENPKGYTDRMVAVLTAYAHARRPG